MNALILGGGLLSNSLIKFKKNKSIQSIYSFQGRVNGYDKEKQLLVNYIEGANKKNKIDCIINCRGYTNVDNCENNKSKAYYLNTQFPELIAELSKLFNLSIIHISTDHVYNGKKNFYKEDEANPINYYGETKLKGEEKLIQNCQHSTVIRCNFVCKTYSTKKSFADSIIESISKNNDYNAFFDAKFTPVSLKKLAKVIYFVYTNKIYGTYNLGSEEAISKYDFAKLIASNYSEGFEKFIKKSFLEDRKDLVKRPINLSLDSTKLNSIILEKGEKVNDIVNNYIEEKRNIHHYEKLF